MLSSDPHILNEEIPEYDDMPIGLALLDNDFRIVQCTKVFCKSVNLRFSEVVRRKLDEVIDANTRINIDTDYILYNNKGISQTIQPIVKLQFYRLPSELKPDWRIALFQDYSEAFSNWSNVLVSSSMKSTQPTIIVDEQGLICSANHAAELLFRCNVDILCKRNVDSFVPMTIRDTHRKLRASFLTRPNVRNMTDSPSLTLHTLDGRKIPVQISLTPLHTTDQTLTMCSIVDMSKRLGNEQIVMSQNKELNRLNEELAQFSYSAAHDLKSPTLTAIGLLQMGLEYLDSGNLSETRKLVNESLNSMIKQVNIVEATFKYAMADFTQRESVPINLKELISVVWQDVGRMETQVPIFELDIGHDDPISMDEVVTRIVLHNLLENTVKYASLDRERLAVNVKTRTVNGNIQIAVQDNGIGIQDKFHSRMFEPFARFSDRSNSTGLGLALVKKHLNRIGGTISFESVYGVGSRFVVELPLKNNTTLIQSVD